MKFIQLICLSALLFNLSLANEIALLRNDGQESYYYEKDTIRRTNQFVMVWDFTIKDKTKVSERLTEFDCKKGLYRQLSHRGFTSQSEVISSDFIYKEWFEIPKPDQITGQIFKIVCSGLGN